MRKYMERCVEALEQEGRRETGAESKRGA